MKSVSEKHILNSNIYYFEDLESFQRIASNLKLKNTFDADSVCIKLNLKQYDKSAKDLIDIFVNKFINAGYIPEIWIESNELGLSVSDFETLIDVEESVKNLGAELSIVENENLFSLDETLNAFEKANNFVQFVKNSKASPLEKYLMIYGYVSSFVYKENEENKANSRQLISVLNSDDIVCAGYSNLLEYMCNAVGIGCVKQIIAITKPNGEIAYHQTNTVVIDDYKYNVHGAFYADSCWDSVWEGKEPYLNYNYALIPISDFANISDNLKVIDNNKHMLYETNNYDEFMFDYFEDFANSEKPNLSFANKIGFAENFSDIDLDISEEDLKSAASNLINLFDEHGIKPDCYKFLNGAPIAFDINYLLSLCLFIPESDNMLHFYLDKMSAYLAGEKAEKEDIFQKTLSGVEKLKDVKKDLEWYFNLQESESENDQSAAFVVNETFIKRYAKNFVYYINLRDYINDIKSGSVAIKIETFSKALKNSFIAQGMSEKDAKKKAERAVLHSIFRSENHFNENAENCFRKEMVNLRMNKKK